MANVTRDRSYLIDTARRVQQLREHLDMSQRKFSEYLGYCPLTIHKLENAQQGLSQDMLTSMKNRTGVNLNWLIAGEGEMIEGMHKTECLDMLVKSKKEFENIISAAYDRTDTLESYIELLQGENNER